MLLIPDDPWDGLGNAHSFVRAARRGEQRRIWKNTTLEDLNITRVRYELIVEHLRPGRDLSIFYHLIFFHRKNFISRADTWEITRTKITDRWFRESFLAVQILPSIVRRARVQHLYYIQRTMVCFTVIRFISDFLPCVVLYCTYHGAPCVATACVEVSCKIDPRLFAKQVYHRQRAYGKYCTCSESVVRWHWARVYRFIFLMTERRWNEFIQICLNVASSSNPAIVILSFL